MTAVTDLRVSEASAAELADALLERMGCAQGVWTLELHAVDGLVRKVTSKSSGGREDLLTRTRGVPADLTTPDL